MAVLDLQLFLLISNVFNPLYSALATVKFYKLWIQSDSLKKWWENQVPGFWFQMPLGT